MDPRIGNGGGDTSLYGRQSSSVSIQKDGSLLNGAIQLNDRQLKILEARKANREHRIQKEQQRQSVLSPNGLVNKQQPRSHDGYGRPHVDTRKAKSVLLTTNKNDGGHKMVDSRTVESSSSETTDEYWAQEPTDTHETVPTTWSESASSAGGSASSASSGSVTASLSSVARKFYGQRLTGKDKKLYDDTGATWNDSRSNVSASTAALSRASSNAVSRSVSKVPLASTEVLSSSSHSSVKQQETGIIERDKSLKLNIDEATDLKESSTLPKSEVLSSSVSVATSSHHRGQDSVMDKTESESDEESLMPLQSRSESLAEQEPHRRPRSPVSTKTEPKSPSTKPKPPRFHKKDKQSSFQEKLREKIASKKRQQTAASSSTSLLQNILRQAPMSGIKGSNVAVPSDQASTRVKMDATGSDVGSKGSEKVGRFSIMKMVRSPRSAGSGSSISMEEKMIMKRVASRASKNPRRENLLRSGSRQMKQLFSSKSSTLDLSPKSDSGKDEANDNDNDETLSETEDRFDASLLPHSPFKTQHTGGDKRGRRSSVRMKMVTSKVMNDLIEENVIPESDEEDEDDTDSDDQPVIQKARSIRSLPDIVKDDEIEIKISGSCDQSSDASFETPQTSTPHYVVRESTQKCHHVAHATQRAIDQINNEDPHGYDEFVNSLKGELAESHKKLYDSFHSMIRGDGASAKPLSMYPGGLDLKTKETITSMSLHAKKAASVECMAGSQMTSDKDLEKMKHGKVQYGQRLLPQSTNNVSITQSQHVQPSASPKDSSVTNAIVKGRSEAQSEELLPNVDADAGGDPLAYEVTLSQHRRKSVAPSPPSVSLSSKKAMDDSNQCHSQKSSESVVSSTDSLFDDIKTQNTAKPLIPAKAISPKMFAPAAEKETIPWNSVKLRSVCESSREPVDETSIPASWTKVRLRPVAKCVEKNHLDTSDDSTESEEFRRIVLKTTPKSACTPQNNLSLALASSASTDISGTVNKPIELERSGSLISRPIKLTESRGTGNRPIKIVDQSKGTAENPISLSKEGSVMIALADQSPTIGLETKLLLNRKGIMKVEAIPGESNATVLWRIDREELKSALMNMSELSVKLIVSAGEQNHQDLRFPSAMQCKKFANALHDLMHGSEGDVKNPFKVDGDSENPVNVEPEDSILNQEVSVHLEQLSEEEQKVLEEFRQRKMNGASADDFLKESSAQMTSNLPSFPSIVNAHSTGPSSPLSEISGAQSSLLFHQSDATDKYRKMLQMKVPREAVRHKMEKDKVDQKVIQSILEEGTPSSSTTGTTPILTPKERKIVDSYQRMLKMGVPAEGVRHKMQKDGIEEKIIGSVFGDEKSVDKKQSIAGELSIVEEAVAETYRKMLKMMIPKEAVQHRMIKDGIDAKIMTAVIGKPPEPPKKSDSFDGQKNKLTVTEESIASSYRKMLKLSIPKEAVRHKMTQEGISEKIMVAVLGPNLVKPTRQKSPQKRGFKPGFHWNPIADDESIAGSVWSKAKPMSDTGTERPEAVIDITKHVELFQKQPESAIGKRKGGMKNCSDTKEMAKLIDLNRANNVAITLKAFNDFTQTDLAQIIEFLDPEGKIKGDRALFMKDLLPSSAEAKAIKSFKGGEDRLVTAEKWFKKIVHIKRIEEKIHTMRTMETFKMDAVVLGRSFQLLTKVCNQVMDSDRLPDLLDMVRQIGNTMNEGRGEAAAGFKLDFLPRLAQTKGSDKKTTALDLVVMLFHVRNRREALMLSSEIPDCQEASRIQISDLMTDVRSLEGSLQKCRKELDQLKREHESSQIGKPPPPRGPVPSDSRSDTTFDVDVKGTMLGRSPNESKSETNGSTGSLMKDRSEFMASFLKARQDGSLNTSSVGQETSTARNPSKERQSSSSPQAVLSTAISELEENEAEFSLDASIRRLEKFVSETSYVILPRLEAERTEAVEACRDLASFFCESGGEKTASNLLKILDEFATGIDQAVVKYDHQQKVQARKEASQKRRSLTSSKPPAPEIHPEPRQKASSQISAAQITDPCRVSINEEGEKKSLVVMVNEMLKMAGDKQVQDFMQGVVYDNPDNRMKRIYDAERARMDPFAARREMMSAIRARKSIGEMKDEEEATLALFDLRSNLEKINETTLQPTGTLASTMSSEVPISNGRRNSRIADRWTRKLDGDSVVELPSESVGKTDSEILSSVSEEVDDNKYRRKKRQSYMERWASRAPVSDASPHDLEIESDVGAFEDMLNKQRQKAIDRWSKKIYDDEEVVE